MTTSYRLFHYLTSSCYCSAGTDLLFMKELKLRHSKLPKQTKTQDSENAGFPNNRPEYLSLDLASVVTDVQRTDLRFSQHSFSLQFWVNPQSNIVNATSPLLQAHMYAILEKVYSDFLGHFVL